MDVLMRSPFGAHYVCHAFNARDDDEEDHTYATMTRVRDWDANVRAGWMPMASGRKRMIDATE
jgi:hypothetical protein